MEDEETQTEESTRSLKSWLWLLTLMLCDSMAVDRHAQQRQSSACSGPVNAGVQTLELEEFMPKVAGVSVATQTNVKEGTKQTAEAAILQKSPPPQLVTLWGKYTRALTVESLCEDAFWLWIVSYLKD